MRSIWLSITDYLRERKSQSKINIAAQPDTAQHTTQYRTIDSEALIIAH